MGKHYEQLTAEERTAIMMMKASNCSARQIALTLRRAPLTITRELKRFVAWPDRPASLANSPAAYDARAASVRARWARFKCRIRSELACDTVLFAMVHHCLAQGRSPSQIAGTLRLMWPDEPQRTVSHETIYTCIYAMPRGELRKDLIAYLRRAKSKRMLGPPFRCSDWFNRDNPICGDGLAVDRNMLLIMREPVMDSLRTLSAQLDNVYLWDPFPKFCPPSEELCSPYDNEGRPLFFDGDHMSGHGNDHLYPHFAERVTSIILNSTQPKPR